MEWNHRVMNCPSENGGEDYFTFKEVYYNIYTKKPESYSDPFMGGDTLEELQELVKRLEKALGNPPLHEKEFEND